GDVETGDEAAVEGVHEDVGAGLELGPSRVGGDQVVGARAAGRDDLALDAVGGQVVDDLEQVGHRLPLLRDAKGAVGLEHAVALIPHRAPPLDPGKAHGVPGD